MNKIIPVTLITGFLGSGKTTLVNQILRKRPELKISVILNEFGDVALESQFVKGHEGDVFELSNGCMCCVAQEDFVRVVRWILQQRPETEYVLIEASGASDPLPVISTFRESDIADKIKLSTVVCVLDATSFMVNKDEYKTVMVQLSNSDMALISKVEMAGESKVSEVEEFVKGFVPRMWVGRIDENLPVEVILDVEHEHELAEHWEGIVEHEHTHEHMGDGIESLFWKEARALDFERVNNFLRKLPANVIRVKGVLNLKNESGTQKYLLQYVGERSEVFADEWKEGEAPYSAIVCVGKDLEKDVLRAQLEELVLYN
jgi:G3E family GTPase